MRVPLIISLCFHLCVRLSETSRVGDQCRLGILQGDVVINGTEVEKGTDVTVNCTHSLSGGSISWELNDELQTGQNSYKLEILSIAKNTTVTCNVSIVTETISCNVTITVKAVDNMVIILVCVGGAAGVLMLFAVVMKIVLRRRQVKRNVRKRQRQQDLDNVHSTVNTVSTVSTYY